MDQPQSQDQGSNNSEKDGLAAPNLNAASQGTYSNPIHDSELRLPRVNASIMELIDEALRYRNSIEQKSPRSIKYIDCSVLLGTVLKEKVDKIAAADYIDHEVFLGIVKELKSLYKANYHKIGEALLGALTGELWYRKEVGPDNFGKPGEKTKWVQVEEAEQMAICKLLIHCDPDFSKKCIVNSLSTGEVMNPVKLRPILKKFLLQCGTQDMTVFLNHLCERELPNNRTYKDNCPLMSTLSECFSPYLMLQTLKAIHVKIRTESDPNDQSEEGRRLNKKLRGAYNLMLSILSIGKNAPANIPIVEYMYCNASSRQDQISLRTIFRGKDVAFANLMHDIAVDYSNKTAIRIQALEDCVAIKEAGAGNLVEGILSDGDPIMVQAAINAVSKRRAMVCEATEILVENLLENQLNRETPLALVTLFWLAKTSKPCLDFLRNVLSRIDYSSSTYSLFYAEEFKFYNCDIPNTNPQIDPELPERGSEFSDIMLRLGIENLLSFAMEEDPVIRDNMNELLEHLINNGHGEAVLNQLISLDSKKLDQLVHFYDQWYENKLEENDFQ